MRVEWYSYLKIINIIIFVVYTIDLVGQNSTYNCGELMTHNHDVYDVEPTITEYVKNKFLLSGLSSEFICDRNQLIPFRTWVNTDSSIIIIDNNIEVEIKIDKHKLMEDENANAYGLIDRDTNIVEVLSEFSVRFETKDLKYLKINTISYFILIFMLQIYQ